MKAHASSAGEAARSGAFTCTRFTLPLSFSELQVCWSPTIQPFRHQGPAISVLSNSVQEPSLALAKKAPTKRRQISIRVFLCLYHPPSILLSAHTFQTGFENLVRSSIYHHDIVYKPLTISSAQKTTANMGYVQPRAPATASPSVHQNTTSQEHRLTRAVVRRSLTSTSWSSATSTPASLPLPVVSTPTLHLEVEQNDSHTSQT